jgi:Flp pilus assembly protein TadG
MSGATALEGFGCRAMLEVMNKRFIRRRLLARRAVRRLARKQDGSAAIEYAVVAPVFFALLFLIFETGLMFWASQTLETAVADAGRLIMTGQAHQKGLNQTSFKDAVCERLKGGLLDVQTKPTFEQFTTTPPYDAQGTFQPGQVGYQPGGPSDIVLVRAYYQWPLIIPRPSHDVTFGSSQLLSAAAAFRNEPFNPPVPAN